MNALKVLKDDHRTVEGLFKKFEQAGERGWLSTALGSLAQALYALDRLDEAERRAGQAAELGGSDGRSRRGRKPVTSDAHATRRSS